MRHSGIDRGTARSRTGKRSDETVTHTPTETSGGGTETDTETGTGTADQNVPDDPPRRVAFGGGGSVQPGGTTTLMATVENPYLFPIRSVQLRLEAPDADWTVEATGDTNLGTIDTASTAEVSWEVTALYEGSTRGD